jgi:hypothetical protein
MSLRLSALFAVGLAAAPAAATDPGLFVQAGQTPSFVTAAGCSHCGTREVSSFGAAGGPAAPKGVLGAVAYPFTIGEGCRNPVGCGTFASMRTFQFGSCSQFYTPGNKCGLCAGGGLFGTPGVIYGVPRSLEPNCTYGSFHNK